MTGSGVQVESLAAPPERLGADAAALESIFAAGVEATYDATRPFALAASGTARLVGHGALNIFLQPGTLAEPSGRRHFLLRADPGALVLPIDPDDVPGGHTIVAIGEPDTRVRELAVEGLAGEANGSGPAGALPCGRGWRDSPGRSTRMRLWVGPRSSNAGHMSSTTATSCTPAWTGWRSQWNRENWPCSVRSLPSSPCWAPLPRSRPRPACDWSRRAAPGWW
jgi:hypothetical protein